MSKLANYPQNVNSVNKSAIKAKKSWIIPDVEIIGAENIKNGTTPHSYEDVLPLKTFQHS